jgi:hypothetical protein
LEYLLFKFEKFFQILNPEVPLFSLSV